LGVAGSKRIAALPDVPTLSERGVEMKGFEGGSWYGIVAPAGTPDDIVAKLNAALNRAVADKALSDRLKPSAVEPVGDSPRQFGDLITSQYNTWGGILKSAGIRPSAE
jgi:tripartite-type tricarboxylate transporter receptor subunit TctC